MERSNGGRGASWSYSHEIGSNVSSSSGTIVSNFSTADASSGSRFSAFSMEAAMHFDSLGIYGDFNGNNMDEEKEEESMRSLVQEFFRAPSANCSTGVCDMSVVERWLTELGVGWVVRLEDGAGASAVKVLDDPHARSWIRALDQIAQTICFTSPLFPDRGSVGLPSICEEDGEPVAEKSFPDRYHFALFIQETMLKVLVFLDVLVALDPNKTEEFLSMGRDKLLPYTYSLFNLLGVHDALSAASTKILLQFHSPTTSVEVQRIENEMDILLSAYKSKLGEPIRSTMEKTMTKSLEEGNDSSSSLDPQGSSGIHKVTLSVMTYIKFLWANYSSVDAAIRGKSVPHTENVRPLDSMIMEMVSCLQGKLANISESFPDQGLRSLFLLNNSYFMLEQMLEQLNLYFYSLQQSAVPSVYPTHKIEDHMNRYVHVSWASLLSCLVNPTPLCLGKNYSPLAKFESKFQKIYTTQKQWKVPDPGLKRRLRQAIINKIIPSYTEYIEDNNVTHPKISPKELKEMLQELFEG